MDENQNYGYQEGNYNTQDAGGQGQPYGNQQYAQNQNAYGQAPQQPQYNQAPYGAQPQYNQAPYGAQQQYNQAAYGQPVKAVVYDAVPVFEELKEQYKGKANFVSIDVDQQSYEARRFGVEAMPTFVFLDTEGNEIDRIVGADADALREYTKQLCEGTLVP